MCVDVHTDTFLLHTTNFRLFGGLMQALSAIRTSAPIRKIYGFLGASTI